MGKNIFATIAYVGEEINKLLKQINHLSERAITGSEYKTVENLDTITKSDVYYYGDNSVVGRVGAPDIFGGVVFHKHIADGFAFQTSNSLSGKNYERRKYNGVWDSWSSYDDKINALSVSKLDKVSLLAQKLELTLPADFSWNPYKVSNTNFCGVGCDAAGNLQVRVGTTEENKTLFKLKVGSVPEVNGKQIATTDKIDISYTLQGGLTSRDSSYMGGTYTDTHAELRVIWDVNNADIFNPNFVYATLPPELRPRKNIYDVIVNTDTGIMMLFILKNGNILRGNTVPTTKPTWIIGFVPSYIRG